jgi:16S rRNA processing protein RimM
MNSSDLIKIGFVKRTHGFKGAVQIKLEIQDIDLTGEPVFIFRDNTPVPFFIEEFSFQNQDQAVVVFEDADEALAKSLVASELFIDKALLGDEYFSSDDLIGYEVTDAVFGLLGPVKELIDNPGQSTLCITHQSTGKEILCPLVPPIVEHVDFENKKISIHLPEGLFHLYIG